jgi:hypothetical protein
MKLKLSRRGYLLSAIGAVAIAGGAYAVVTKFGGPAAPPYVPGDAVARRLTPDQYRTIIADVFGPEIQLGARFEPEVRIDGLLAIGAGKVSVTPAGMEQYDVMADTIAAQVTDERRRDLLIPCRPADAGAPDDACAGKFLTKVGRLLFRRPMKQEETKAYVGAARAAAETLHDFYRGLSMSLAAMLESPQFLFRHATLEPDPDRPGSFRLDAYSAASQLSFFLWNTGPDAELLDAAERGDLYSRRGLKKQVERMIASPRVESSVRAFFSDMFSFDGFETLAKDSTIYPYFSSQVAEDAAEQTLRTLVDVLLTQRGDYRSIFTTRKTYMTQALAAVYAVPLPHAGFNGSPDAWQEFEFPEKDPRAGILSQVSFVALHSPAGRGSATLRGKALREIMLCQKVPPPPPNVMFTLVEDTSNPQLKTARSRLSAHSTNPTCAGCHKIMDPVGLSFENFDGSGAYRTAENGVKIDASGQLDGVEFKDALGLGQAVHDNRATTACLVDRMTAFALGRAPAGGERAWLADLKEHFADDGYIVPDLMKSIAMSEEFYRAAAPKPGATSQPVRTAMTMEVDR